MICGKPPSGCSGLEEEPDIRQRNPYHRSSQWLVVRIIATSGGFFSDSGKSMFTFSRTISNGWWVAKENQVSSGYSE
jgi:hypothetical protein